MFESELLASGSGFGDLDPARLADYLVNIAGDLAAPPTQDAWEQRLTGLGFMVTRADGPPACTIAGLVLFGRKPRRALRHAGVRWMSFAGTDMQYQAQDDTVLDGPLLALMTGKAGGGRSMMEEGLVECLADRMLPFISEEGSKLVDALRRERTYRYSAAAVRETVLNALVHRDWTRPEEVEVVSYADRLLVTSPGALQNSMTIEKMLAGQRSAQPDHRRDHA